LIPDKITGKSRGFAFIAFEDQRSTILAVDNFNGAKVCVVIHARSYLPLMPIDSFSQLLGRMIRVDHVRQYRRPKSSTEAGSEGVNETDEDYDTRRKRIWDYEAYAEAPPSLEPASRESTAVDAPKATTETVQDVERQSQRIEEIRRKRQARRERQRHEERILEQSGRR
jgi:RNA-binding motif X-linked protein 2